MSTLSLGSARASSALLVLAGVLWGTGGLAGALLQDAADISPVAVAAYRLLVGGGVATLVCVKHLHELWDTARVKRLVVSGSLLAVFQVAYQVAVSLISVSLATLITIGCAPVIVAVVGAVRACRWPSRQILVAVGGALVGLGLLVGEPTGATAWQLAWGVGMSVLAGAGFAVLTLVTASPGSRHTDSAAALLLGGVLITPFTWFDGGMGLPLKADVFGLVLYLGIVPTAIAYGAYFLGLRHAHPTLAALTTMLEPVTATTLSFVLLGERLSFVGVVGALLIVGALVVAPRRSTLSGPPRTWRSPAHTSPRGTVH